MSLMPYLGHLLVLLLDFLEVARKRLPMEVPRCYLLLLVRLVRLVRLVPALFRFGGCLPAD